MAIRVGDWVIGCFSGNREVCAQVVFVNDDKTITIGHGRRSMVLQPRTIEAKKCLIVDAIRTDGIAAQDVLEKEVYNQLAFTLLRELVQIIRLFLWPVSLQEFEVGDQLDVCDYRGVWYGGEVVEKSGWGLCVRYCGWNPNYDENFSFASVGCSNRWAPLGRITGDASGFGRLYR